MCNNKNMIIKNVQLNSGTLTTSNSFEADITGINFQPDLIKFRVSSFLTAETANSHYIKCNMVNDVVGNLNGATASQPNGNQFRFTNNGNIPNVNGRWRFDIFKYDDSASAVSGNVIVNIEFVKY